jgi:hypothetical protein
MEVASGMRLITSSFSVVTGVASRVQAHRREGERSSPDSGDPSARDPKAHPRTAHHQNQITVAHPDGRYGADLTGTHDQNGSPENQHQALTGYLGATHKAHQRTDDRVVGWDDLLHQHRW